MAGNLNKVQIIGRLGKDPEVRYTKDGKAVANLRIATSEQWTDKSGEKQERTEWHAVVLWGRQAEVAEQYLQKGRLVYIEGKLETRKWQDQSGADRYTTEIRAFDMQMLDKGDGQRAGGGDRGERSGGGDREERSGGGDREERSESSGGGSERRGFAPSRGGGGSRPAPSDDDAAPPPPDEDDIPF